MCGRFTLTDPDPRMLRMRFNLSERAQVDEEPRFNIAPTDPVLAIRTADEDERELGRLRWGLVPSGKTPKEVGRPLINLRAESVRSGSFRSHLDEQRCLIPADGFYEWQKTDEGKVPVWISMPDGEPFAFAGLWARSKADDGSDLHSCTIITCEPSDQIRPIHNRMPVILERDAEALWLDPDSDPGEVVEALRPGPEDLRIREVPDLVNDVRNDGPELIEERQAEQRLF